MSKTNELIDQAISLLRQATGVQSIIAAGESLKADSLPAPQTGETIMGYGQRVGVPVGLIMALVQYSAYVPNGTSWQQIVWDFLHHTPTAQEQAQDARDAQVNVPGVGFTRMEPHEVDAVLIYFDEWQAKGRPDVAWSKPTNREICALQNRGLTMDFISKYIAQFNSGQGGGSDPADGAIRAHVE